MLQLMNIPYHQSIAMSLKFPQFGIVLGYIKPFAFVNGIFITLISLAYAILLQDFGSEGDRFDFIIAIPIDTASVIFDYTVVPSIADTRFIKTLSKSSTRTQSPMLNLLIFIFAIIFFVLVKIMSVSCAVALCRG